MPTLYVRNFPEELLRRIKELAARRQRSLGAEVTVLIDAGLQQEELRSRRISALKSISRRRRSYKPTAGAADSLALLREDRAR